MLPHKHCAWHAWWPASHDCKHLQAPGSLLLAIMPCIPPSFAPLLCQVPCAPQVTACPNAPVPTPNPAGAWQYARVGGALSFDGGSMPFQPAAWQKLDRYRQKEFCDNRASVGALKSATHVSTRGGPCVPASARCNWQHHFLSADLVLNALPVSAAAGLQLSVQDECLPEERDPELVPAVAGGRRQRRTPPRDILL